VAAKQSKKTKAKKPAAKPKKPTQRRTAKQPAAKRKPKPLALLRDPHLEAAIIAAPLEATPRMVYADWLMGAGDLRGEWMAISTAIENDPANRRLRSIAVEWLGAHSALLLGGGLSLLPGAWIGWRGGFIDELRLQPVEDGTRDAAALAALLAHPSCRFLRHLSLGCFYERDEMLDALVDAAPPLLESLVLLDTTPLVPTMDIPRVAELGSLRRLGLNGVAFGCPIPQIVELRARATGPTLWWLATRLFPNLEELTLSVKFDSIDSLIEAIAALPRLRRLRLLGLHEADRVVALLRALPIADRLELLDLSGSDITDLRPAQLHPSLTLVAHRAGADRVRDLWRDPGRDGKSWIQEQLRAEGREALRLFPGIGNSLYSIGTDRSIDRELDAAIPLLDASLTFPGAQLKTWAWANAAIAHERRRDFEAAELTAREGLLRAPDEPNLYAIVVDALRRSDRLAQALALLPKAIKSITAKPGPGAHVGGPPACLADCLLVLQQGGEHDRVVALATKRAKHMQPRSHAIVAMSQAARKQLVEARASLAKAKPASSDPLYHHAVAVLALAKRTPDRAAALRALATAKAGDYPEWHFVPRDPLLRAVHGDPLLAP
jgi:uncharacterized protein (TIGR02996 family)